MAENTAIEWADHIDPNATGRVLGAYKVAARRTGCDLAEWLRRRSAGEKWCFQCRTWKSGAIFALDRSRRGGRTSRCRPCTSAASTAARYGMTVDKLAAFRATHGERCGICEATESLNIDHDHATGVVRGLLCPNCNSAIGKLKESPTLMAAALAYLEKHRG